MVAHLAFYLINSNISAVYFKFYLFIDEVFFNIYFFTFLITIGLLNAADHYGLEELRRACLGFLHGCINVDTVCLLLKSAEKYIQYKATKSLVQKVGES